MAKKAKAPRPMRAERTVKIDKASYTLIMDMNALADFEADTGESAMAVIASLDSPNPNSTPFLKMRHLVWAALRQAHPDATVADAGRVMSENPEVLQDLLIEAMPEPDPASEDELDAEGEPGNGKASGG